MDNQQCCERGHSCMRRDLRTSIVVAMGPMGSSRTSNLFAPSDAVQKSLQITFHSSWRCLAAATLAAQSMDVTSNGFHHWFKREARGQVQLAVATVKNFFHFGNVHPLLSL